MTEEILINVTPRETRVAVVENGMLQELHIERGWRRGVVGNIYKGRVQRVMPGHAGGVRRDRPGPRRVPARLRHRARRRACRAGDGEEAPLPPRRTSRPIAELVREGQDIVVQVVKDPIGSKGARLTTQLSIPSRYLVLLPQSRVVGVSARIEDEAERARLKALVAELRRAAASQGYIVRTNAEGQPARSAGRGHRLPAAASGRWSRDQQRSDEGRRAASTKT